ncbi:hypothetical protein TELCIR_07006 [Teladorsagia circumcincta]|uniref:Uncharacterized protein n=1 Tax=Teladorsagia circumcincta TaxID=45464 RepID=A0A2G9UMZ9_TELCI|nr:hypothetical protein TELCIR_07006 [Teladorsagia circumcincta]
MCRTSLMSRESPCWDSEVKLKMHLLLWNVWLIHNEICLAVLNPGGAVASQSNAESHNHPFRIKAPFALQKNSYRYRHPKRTGQLCNICRQLFPLFTDYEAHLKDGSCSTETPPDPVPIHMSDSGNVPLNYDLSPITKPMAATKSRVMICTLCHDDRFSSVTEFHEHIIDCARKLAACSELSS